MIDYILVEKSKNEMRVFSEGKLLKIYKVSFGDAPVGHKKIEDDEKTPEGIYYIYGKNPHSVCYKNLGISYPNKKDIESAKKIGKNAGGDIKIHGLKNGFGFIGKFQRFYNWTNGCIAVTNSEMDELYNNTKINAKIEIRP